MSQLQHRNENQNFISNFVLQFIKKTKWHFRYTVSLCFVKQQGLESLSFQNISAFQTESLIKLETTKYFRQAKQHLPQAISAI